MPTTASIRRESASTFDDSINWEIGIGKDRNVLDNIPAMNKFTGGTNNLIDLEAYRGRQLTGVPDEKVEQIDEFDSSKSEDQEREVFWVPYLPQRKQQQESSKEFIRITRAIFMKPILQALDEIQPYVKTPDASIYVHNILHTIQKFDYTSPNDPFLEILSGLYMALAFENQWADYEAEQYASIRKLLKVFAERPTLKPTDIEKTIMKMEDIGFDTTPIPIVPENFDE